MKKYFITLLLLTLAGQSHALRLTLTTEQAPPNSYIENGHVVGRSVDVVQAVLKEIGMGSLKIKMMPWARGYELLKARPNIALFATARTQKREKLFKWAGPISDNAVNLYKLRSREDIQPKVLEDLKKYRIGGGYDDQKSQFLTDKGFKLEHVNEDKQNLYKLLLGRLDVIPYSASRLNFDSGTLGFDPKKVKIIWNVKEISTQVYIAFSLSTSTELVDKFQRGFNNIKKNGVQDKILSKWNNSPLLSSHRLIRK